MKRIYLAGKIAKNDWRHVIFPGLREIAREQGQEVAESYNEHRDVTEWDEHDILSYDGRWTYTGPYFSGCDHGCTHDQKFPGHAVTGGCVYAATRSKDWGHQTGYRPWVYGQCVRAISRCDIFFAWLDDDTTAYGTLVEIGIARGMGKRVVIATPPRVDWTSTGGIDDMWFALETASKIITASTAVDAFRNLQGELT